MTRSGGGGDASPRLACAARFRGSWPLLLLAAVGAAFVFGVLARVPGISPDSVQYVAAARNLASGGGLTVLTPSGSWGPLTHFPPLYPMVLAAPMASGVPLFTAIALINALSFGVSVFLVGSLVRRGSGSGFTALAAAAVAATGFPLLSVHSWAWSEPLFIALTLGSLSCIARWRASGGRALLAAAALLAGAASLTRYAGVAGTIAGIALVGAARKDGRRRWLPAIAYGSAALFPLALWGARSALVGTGAERGGRELAFHPVGLKQAAALFGTVGGWLVPGDAAGPWRICAGAAALVLASGVAASPFRKRPRGGIAPAFGREVGAVVLAYAAAYLALLAVSLSFYDAHTPLDDRILSPLFAVLVAGAAAGAAALTAGRRVPAVLLAAVWLAILVVQVPEAAAWTRQAHHGLGYSQPEWRGSQLLRFVASLPSGTPIYTNGPDAVLYIAGRRSAMLPMTANPLTLRRNQAFDDEVAAMAARLREGDGVLIYLHGLAWRRYLPSLLDLYARLPLRGTLVLPEGTIYRVGPGAR